MGITIRADRLEERLEDAVRLAESDAELPSSWLKRTAHIAECPSQTYVAAFGVALLAKASDDRVDVLTIKASVSETAYSMRGVAKVLTGRARHYGYDLGVSGPEPLNNQPWFGNDRVDRIERVKQNVVPYQLALVRYLRDLNALDADEALHALAAFLRLRLDAGRMKKRNVVIANPGGALEDVIATAQAFIRQDPEGGKRGQAVVAAIFDCVSDEVQTGAINNPRAFDVRVDLDSSPILAIEVKQKPVGSDEILYLAASAQEAGIDKALYAALAIDQAPIDRPDVRGRAASDHGVFLAIATSIEEVVEHALLGSASTSREMAELLPARIDERLVALRVSEAGVQHWRGLHLTG